MCVCACHAVLFIAFTMPKVYELKKTEIDSVVALANSKMGELYDKFDQTVLKSESCIINESSLKLTRDPVKSGSL